MNEPGDRNPFNEAAMNLLNRNARWDRESRDGSAKGLVVDGLNREEAMNSLLNRNGDDRVGRCDDEVEQCRIARDGAGGIRHDHGVAGGICNRD